MSQNVVTTIVQDDKGFLWFGTQDGLNRFDGHHFETFHYRPNNSDSLPAGYIESLFLDHVDVLWVGTLNGLCYSLPGKEQFRAYPLNREEGPNIPFRRIFTSFHEDSDGSLWLGNAAGEIYRLSSDRADQTYFDLDPARGVGQAPVQIRGIARDASKTLWVGMYHGGLARYKPESALQWSRVPITPEGLPTKEVRNLFTDSKGQLWILTEGAGVIALLPGEPPRFRHYALPADQSGLKINAMVENQRGGYWLATSEGLVRFNPDQEKPWQLIRHIPGDPSTPSTEYLLSAYRDKEGTFWFGTNRVGVEKMVPITEEFEHGRQRSGFPSSLSSNQVTGFWKDNQGGLWVSTYDGLNYRQPGSDTYQHYLHDPTNPQSLGGNDLTFVMGDTKGNLWVGTFGGGLNHYIGNGHFKRFLSGGANSISHDSVSAMVEDNSGDLWVSTFGGGLNQVLDAEKGIFRNFLHDPNLPGSLAYDRISGMTVGPQNQIWIATLGAGLDMLDANRSTFAHYRHDPNDPQSLSQDILMSLHIDHKGTLWVGTETTGLNKKVGDHFIRYDNRSGLPNNVVYGILEDSEHNLWLSTNKGISRFNPTDETFFNYDMHDGLQSDEFNQGAFYQDNNGRMYFGGINGFTSFLPQTLKQNSLPPTVVITKLLLDNMEPPISSEPGSVLKKPIGLTQSIQLPPEISSFAVSFAALSFINPKRNSYAYRLEPFEENWVHTDARNRRATYTHLPPGDYTLRVKGRNRDGVWNEGGTSLQVTVSAPFYRRPIAFAGYALLIFVAVAVYLRQSASIRIALKRKVEERTQELREKAKDLEDRYAELEALEGIVKTINREVAFDKVIESLMEQALILFPSANASGFMLLDEDRSTYRIAAVKGLSLSQYDDYQLNIRELTHRFGNTTEQLEEGIYRANHFEHLDDGNWLGMEVPKSMIAMAMMLDGVVEGILILGNMQEEKAFARSDIKRLKRFQEHAVSALGKARVIRELAEARAAIAQTAHKTGMAEIATNVTHELGNALNGIRTSTELIGDKMQKGDASQQMGRLVSLFKEHEGNLPQFFAENPKGKLIPQFMEKLETRLNDYEVEIIEKLRKLVGQVDDAVSILQAQHAHTDGGQPLRVEVDLNVLMEQALKTQGYLLRSGQVNLIKEQRQIPHLTLEENKLLRVVVYLLNNAWEALQQVDNKQIVCATGLAGWTAYLEIRDNGPGLPCEEVSTLFQYGYTTKEGHQGFGLHYCANTIHEMGGELTLTRNEEKSETIVRVSFAVPKV